MLQIFVAHRQASHKWPIPNICRLSVCVSQMADFFIFMTLKHFYFIKDSFFEEINDPTLLKNKEDGSGRPCFFAVEDIEGYYWMIPVSSEVDKLKEFIIKK